MDPATGATVLKGVWDGMKYVTSDDATNKTLKYLVKPKWDLDPEEFDKQLQKHGAKVHLNKKGEAVIGDLDHPLTEKSFLTGDDNIPDDYNFHYYAPSAGARRRKRNILKRGVKRTKKLPAGGRRRRIYKR